MPSRYVITHQEKAEVAEEIMNIPHGATVYWYKGKSKFRSIQQNRLQRLWIKEAAEQLKDGETEDYRAYCKLHYGVPILRNENDEFKIQYDKVVKPLSYENKLEIMKEPIDFPVTRLMTPKQKRRYLDSINVYLTGLGVCLTNPDDMSEYGGWQR